MEISLGACEKFVAHDGEQVLEHHQAKTSGSQKDVVQKDKDWDLTL